MSNLFFTLFIGFFYSENKLFLAISIMYRHRERTEVYLKIIVVGDVYFFFRAQFFFSFFGVFLRRQDFFVFLSTPNFLGRLLSTRKVCGKFNFPPAIVHSHTASCGRATENKLEFLVGKPLKIGNTGP